MTTGPTNRTRTLAVLTALALAGGGLAALGGGTAAAAVGGELVYGLTTDDRLVSFGADTPGTIFDNKAITAATGTTLPEDFLGIDVRPRTGELYALGDNSQLYVIDPATGVATARGDAIRPALSGTKFGFDFNPVADRVRIVSDADQNLRVNPTTGGPSAVTAPGTNTDGPLRYAETDPNAGGNPEVAAAAYTMSVDQTTTTQQFDIDVSRNTFVRQDSNPGTLSTIGNLGAGDVLDAGLDVSAGTDTTYGLLQTSATSGTTTRTVYGFYTIDRATGAATLRGEVGPAATATTPALAVEDITVATSRFSVAAATGNEGTSVTVTVRRTGDTRDAQSVDYRLTSGTAVVGEDVVATTGTLSFGPGEVSRTFAVATLNDDFTEGAETLTVVLNGPTAGAVASGGTLTLTDDEAGRAVGLTADDQLVFFSVNNPGTATGVRQVVLPLGVDLVGIDVRPRTGVLYGVGDDSRVYTIDQTTGIATAVGVLGTPLDGAAFGVDFNPVADRLRIVSDRDQNLRVNVDAPAAGTTLTTIVDGVLRYVATDANAPVNPSIGGAGYINSVNNGAAGTATPTVTTLYDIDTATTSLVRQDPPNEGGLVTVGSLGLPAGTTIASPATVGLDIAAAGNAAFATFGTSTAAATALYRVDLASGRATSLGALADGVEDVALLDTARATFTPPTSPSPSASATPTVSATPSQSVSPTPTATVPGLPQCTTPLRVTTNREFIVPTIPVTVTVTGAAPGALVDLQAYSRPNVEFGSVRTRAADNNGTISFDVVPGTNTRLFAQCVNEAGGPGQAGSVSNQRVINVRTALSLSVVRNGRRDYTFQGRILPRRADQLITLYRVESNGTRVITSQLKTDSTGTYRFRRVFTGSGTFGFLARTGQTLTNAAGESTSPAGQRSDAYLSTGRGTPRPTAIF